MLLCGVYSSSRIVDCRRDGRIDRFIVVADPDGPAFLRAAALVT